MQRNIYAMQQREYFVYLKQEWSQYKMKKYKGIIFDSAGLGEASKYSKTTYKLNNFKEILDIVQLGVIVAVKTA